MYQILASDLHLTDDPYDQYRWGFFPWLKGKIREAIGEAYPHEPAVLYILGDICDKKDRHSEKLVNRVVDEVVGLYRGTGLMEIVFLAANHDGLDQPYFKFLRHFPYIKYITEPQIIIQGRKRIAMLPYTKRPEHDWKEIDFATVHYALAHITVTGAKSESDFVLEGTKGAEFLKNLRLGKITGESRVFSGDVHVPQRVGAVEYVGAPYPVRFGDRFRGRVLVLGGPERRQSWHYPTLRKAKIVATGVDSLKRAWLRSGDQLKVELALPKSLRHDFHRHREEIQKWCEEKGVILRGLELSAGPPPLRLREKAGASGVRIQPKALSSEEALTVYARRTNVNARVRETGTRLLKVAQKGS